MAKPWRCPVDGQEFASQDKLDEHIKTTGHVMYDDTEDKGKETPKEPDDLSYSQHSGYTPGISSGDVKVIHLILKVKTEFNVNLQKVNIHLACRHKSPGFLSP